MDREVKWTELAWSDLEQVAQYISKDSTFYAASFVREVLDYARALSYHSERGHIVSEIGDPSIREILVRKYRLIYEVKPNVVHILGFIHGARDFPALWGPNNRQPNEGD